MLKRLLWMVFMLGILSGKLHAYEGVRVFSDTSSGDQSPLVTCVLEGGSVSTNCLGGRAYEIARETGALSFVPESNQTEISYVDLFKRWNGLGETMTSTQFERKATGTGFYLPRGQGRAAPLPSDEWYQIQADINLLKEQIQALTPESPVAITELQSQIAALEQRLVGVDDSTASLMGTLDTLKGVLYNYLSLSQSERDVQTAEIDERFSNIAARVTVVEQQLSAKAEQRDVSALSVRVAAIEEAARAETKWLDIPSMAQWPWWVWIGVGLLCLGILWLWLRTQPSSLETKVQSLDSQINNPVIGVMDRLSQVEEVSATARKDVSYLLKVSTDNLRIEGVPDQETLDALEVGKHLDLQVKQLVQDATGQSLVVRIVRGTLEQNDGTVVNRLYLYGVEEVNNGLAVQATNLSRTIHRALLERRVAGIDPQTEAGLTPASFNRRLPVKTIRQSRVQAE